MTKHKYKDKPKLLAGVLKYFAQMEHNKIIRVLTGPPVLEQPVDGPITHYNAWFPVERPDKPTTPVRPVWDASAKSYKGANSLNDCLLAGANYLMDGIGFLLRFRMALIVLFGDIRQAYLQCGLNEDSVHACRFLSLADPSKGVTMDNIVQYCLQRVSFGLSCSQFLLMATIREHLKRQNTPLADELILNAYSDNIMLCSDTPEEALAKVTETVRIFRLASMEICQFFSNSKAVNEALNVPADQTINKVLGVSYNTEADMLFIVFHCDKRPKQDTKRSVLKTNSKNYDPLSLASPATVMSKQFFQDLFSRYKGWNDVLSAEDQESWDRLITQWADVALEFPRMIAPPGYDEVEIHAYADANAGLMCVAIYLVFVKDGNVPPVCASLKLASLL